MWIAAVHPILRATWDKAYNQPVRFNRQRREICYVPEGSDKPLYQSWESMVVWYNTGVVATGHAVMTHYQFGFAIDDPSTNLVHPLNLPVSSAHHALGLWESIRRFMEHGPDHCPKPLPPQGSNTLDEERAEIHRLYRIGHKSGFQLFLWYVWRIYTWWRVPYWVAEWDKNYAYRYVLPEVEAWSAPLPPEQWAQPSEQLRQESARIRYALSQGHSFLDYCQGNVEVPDELPALYYQEGPLDGPLQPPPDAKRRGKKAAEFKRKAKAHEIARHRKRIDLQRQRAMKRDQT
ncbi:MAG: hypothetical protein II007_00425 [Gammaproteobacteria bacterium]|nr:hypothetical protein [Gammaproteobacteria bacterium]